MTKRKQTPIVTAIAVLLVATGSAAWSRPTVAEQHPAARISIDKSASSFNLVGHGGPVKAIAARDTSPSSTMELLTGSFDYSMIHWQLDEKTGRPRAAWRYPDHGGAVSAVAFFPDGNNTAASASDDGTVHIWDLGSGTRRHKMTGHAAKILGLDVSSDGRQIASASWDRTLRVWDTHTGKLIITLTGHKGPVNAVQFSHDGRHLISASTDGTIGLWKIATGELIRPAYKHGWGINVLERLSTPGHVAFGALDGTAAIVDIETGKLIRTIAQRDKPILALDHTAKRGVIAIGGGDGLIDVVHASSGKPIERFKNPYGPVWSLAFVDGYSRLYFGSLDDFATAWQVTPRKPFETVPTAKFPRRFQVKENVSLGERQFARKCSICHTLSKDGKNRAGPTLHGIFGRRIATLAGYPYSKSLKKMDIVWDENTISKLFELGPHEFTPGSKMPLQKITDTKKRNALIAYLKEATATKPAHNKN